MPRFGVNDATQLLSALRVRAPTHVEHDVDGDDTISP